MRRRRMDLDVGILGDEKGDGRFRYCRNLSDGNLDALSHRAEALNGKDRALMKMYLSGAEISYMAKLAGASETTIIRRIARISARLVDPEYSAFLKKRENFSTADVAIARDHYIGGMSNRKIAEKRGISAYLVKQTLLRIKSEL